MTATDTTSSVNSSSKSMQTFLDKCALIKKQHRQSFNDFSFLQVSPLAFVKPLRKDDDSDDDVNNKREKMRANRETKILNELEMCERTGDVVFRSSSKMKSQRTNECVFRLNSLSVAEEEERRGRRGREKIIAYRMKIWTLTDEKEKKVVLYDNSTTWEDTINSSSSSKSSFKKSKKLLLARVDADPNRTSDGFQLRGVSLALAAEAERLSRTNSTSKEDESGDDDTLKIEMTSNVAFKHPSMNRKSDTFREIFKDVDANAKLACEARLVEAFEIIEIHELSTYEKSTTADHDKDDNDEKNARVGIEIEGEEERLSRSAVLKRVVVPGESWETASDFSEISLRINDMNAKSNAHTFVLKRHESKKDSYERFVMALVRTMRKKETSVAFVPKERFLDFTFPQHEEVGKVIDAIRKNNNNSYDYEDYVATEVHLVDWVSARDCFGDGKVIKTVLEKRDPSKSFPNDSPVQDTKVYISNLCASAKTTSGTENIIGTDKNEQHQIGEDFSFRLASGEMPRALETALRTACIGETIRVTVDVREEERTAFALKQRKERMRAYLDSYVLSDTLTKLVSRDDDEQNLLKAEDGGFRLVQVTFECTLTGFDKIVNWYSDAVAVCIKDGEDLKTDANALFKNGMLIEALEKYESVAQKLNQLASRVLLEEEEGEKNEPRIVALRNNVLLNAAVTAKKLRDYTAARKSLEKIPENERSFKAKMLKGCIFLDENEFDLAKEAFRELLTDIAADEDEDEVTKDEKKKELERELARVKQLEKRALEEMRNKFRGKL
jgi:tetratricopeptide (TPR) repeat protein